MNNTLDIKKYEVFGYREIYYGHVKPMINKGKHPQEISDRVTLIAECYGLTEDRYKELQWLDLLQWMAKIKFNKVPDTEYLILTDDLTPVPDDVLRRLLELPELKCPIRTDQK